MEAITLEQILRWINSPFVHLGQTPVTLSGILVAALVIMFTFYISGFMQRTLVVRLTNRLKLAPGVTYALRRFIHYGTIFLGIMIAAQCVGLNFSGLAIVFGFLSVGIGFGLQNVTSNFIAGLILLLEQPISVDDFISVEGQVGKVKQINMHSTVIETLDRISIIIPNSKFIENHVINWSHSDPMVRVHCAVGVAYGSDLELVRRELLGSTTNISHIVTDPAPEVRFVGFGDSSLNFELLVWTDTPERQYALHSQVNFAIDAAFRKANIQIPFPQRDVHLRTIPAATALTTPTVSA